jgi:hypothetical protein
MSFRVARKSTRSTKVIYYSSKKTHLIATSWTSTTFKDEDRFLPTKKTATEMLKSFGYMLINVWETSSASLITEHLAFFDES